MMNILRWTGWLCILLGSQAMAQTPYPGAPATPSGLQQGEYFFDADPGFGKGTALSIPAATNISTMSKTILLNGAALTNGFHRLYVRFLDGDGRWSLTENVLFNNLKIPDYANGGVSGGTIASAEYFIDLDPGIGNGTAITVPAAPDLNNLSVGIHVTNITAGVHTLYVRAKDSEGKWSLTNIAVFDNSSLIPYPSAPGAVPVLQKAEYFIDTDPGFGSGNPINLPAGTEAQGFSLSIPLAGLSQGIHHLYLRSVSTPWGLTAVSEFLVGSTLPLHWLWVKGELEDENCLLHWSTALEENTDSFLVEHSTDGSTFTVAGALPAKNTGPAVNVYSFLHRDMVPGANYYRIKQVDKDGRSSYSPTILVVSKSNLKETVIGPNPTYGQLSIIQPASAFLDGYAIHTTGGIMVVNQTARALKERIWSLNVSRLPPGEYMLTLFYKQNKKVFRFLKQ